MLSPGSHLSGVFVDLIPDPQLPLFCNPVIRGTMAPHVPVSERLVYNPSLSKPPSHHASCTSVLAAVCLLLQAAPSKQLFDVEKENCFV